MAMLSSMRIPLYRLYISSTSSFGRREAEWQAKIEEAALREKAKQPKIVNPSAEQADDDIDDAAVRQVERLVA